MEGTKVDGAVSKNEKSQLSVTTDVGNPEESCSSTSRFMTEQEVINKSWTNALRSVSSSSEPETISKGEKGSPELTRRMSRTQTVRQDAIKLKSATLGRMGKMFKQRSQTPVADKSSLSSDGIVTSTKSVENCSEESSRKEKTNSLGRMLKLVDKDGSPRKLFHPRAGSLSRILRRHSPNQSDDVVTKPAEDAAPGIFSRMLSQLRGRPPSGNATAEPNMKSRNKMGSLPPKVPLNSRTSTHLSPSSSPSSSPTQPTRSSQKLASLECSL